jgi:hypothetical protein
MAIAGVEYGPEVDEFKKAGLTPIPSELVRPPRVAESPVQMECVVEQILPLGESGGAGNLIICRIVLMHIAEEVLNDKGRIDPHKIDLMGRLGRFYYVRASGAAIEEIVQEATTMGVGFDGLPEDVRFSPVLTGNHLGMLAGLPVLPTLEEAMASLAHDARAHAAAGNCEALQIYAREALDQGNIPLGAALAVVSCL